MKAISDKIIVIPDKTTEEVNHRGIFIPITAKKTHLTGKVYLVGPEVKTTFVGDSIAYDMMMGMNVEFEGVEYVMMREGDMIGVLKSANQ